MVTERQSWGQRLFINRDFGLLFFGRLVSQIGDGIHYLALTWLVLDLTGSGTALGTMLFTASIPAVALAPFSGVLADLWNRKSIVVSMDIVRGLILLGLAVVFRAGHLTLPILYVATVFSSLCGVLFGPAISATIPSLVKKDQLIKANSLNNFSRAATMIIGPVLGAFLLATSGYFGVFLINGTAFLLSAISEIFIRFPKVLREEKVETSGSLFWISLKEGFIFVWNNRGLRTLIFYATVLNFVSSPLFGVVFPYWGKEILKLEAQHFGAVQAMFPFGFLIGTVVIGFLTKRYRKKLLLTLGVIGQGFMVALFAILANPGVVQNIDLVATVFSLSGGVLIIGICNTLVNVPLQVLLQETVPDGYRGRVYGLLDSMVQVLVPLSMALSGVLVDGFSIAGILATSGVLTVVLGLGMATSHSIKRLYTETA